MRVLEVVADVFNDKELSFSVNMDPRFDKILDILVQYSNGNFDYSVAISPKRDEIDSIIYCINMLGEELKASTISRDHFNNVINSVSDMLFVLSSTGIIKAINRSVNEHLKYEEVHLRGMSINVLVDEKDDVQFFDRILDGFRQGKDAVELEITLLTRDMKVLPVFCSCTYLYDQLGEKTGFVFTAKDITRIKRFEHFLRESESMYRRIFEESSDPIFVIDAQGNFIDLNKAGIQLLKCNQDDIQGINFFNFFLEKDKEGFLKELQNNGSTVNCSVKLMDQQKKYISCLISASEIKDEFGKRIGYQGIIKDVSKQREIDNLLIRTVVDTQEKERKRFAKDLHDSLGQRLSAVKYFLETLRRVDPISTQKHLKMLNRSNEALDDALADLRNICFNLMPGTLHNFGLKYAVRELCKKIEFTNMLEFDVVFADNFPELSQSLEIAIFRIVQEFINNAIKHGKAKNIRIEMSYTEKEDKLHLHFEDDGQGFELRNIWDYAGMGLMNVKSRVESYNGDIKIESGVNEGTKFIIVMPASISSMKINLV